jgi:hypothetical protein
MTRKKILSPFQILMVVVAVFSLIFNSCPELKEDPISNVVKVKGDLTISKWLGELQKIYDNGVYVILDLTECEVSDPPSEVLRQEGVYVQFNPMPDISLGKKFIEAIILPDEARAISHATALDYDKPTGEIDKEISDKSAFRHFSNLYSVTGKNIISIGNFAFFNRASLEKVDFPRVTHIYQGAFMGCAGFRNANFDLVKTISIRAFEGCTGLKTVNIPDITYIDHGAFKNCKSLESVNFPRVTIIDQDAFNGCTGLKEVMFFTATKIGNNAFRNCTSLKTARFWGGKNRTTSGHPVTVGGTPPFDTDSVVFYPHSMRGCKSLETLDIRNAWNVYFAGGSLADIGTHLRLLLFDDDGARSYGHPQTDNYLGNPPQLLPLAEGAPDNGKLTLKSIILSLPVSLPTPGFTTVDNMNGGAPGYVGLRYDIEGRYTKEGEDANGDPIDVPSVDVIVQRRSGE